MPLQDTLQVCVNQGWVCNIYAWIFFSKQRYVTNFQLDLPTLPLKSFTIKYYWVSAEG